MTKKETFIQIYQEKIKRRGAEQLLNWLQSDASDFFTAPSSTRYHGSYEGGLVEHSLNVYDCLVDYLARPRTKERYGMDYSEETVALVALLHDLMQSQFLCRSTTATPKMHKVSGKKSPTIPFEIRCRMDTEKNPSICCPASCGSPEKRRSPSGITWAFPVRRIETRSAEHWNNFRWHWL